MMSRWQTPAPRGSKWLQGAGLVLRSHLRTHRLWGGSMWRPVHIYSKKKKKNNKNKNRRWGIGEAAFALWFSTQWPRFHHSIFQRSGQGIFKMKLIWCNFRSALTPGSTLPSGKAREFFACHTRLETAMSLTWRQAPILCVWFILFFFFFFYRFYLQTLMKW